MQPTIEQFMTPLVHTIRSGAHLSEAHEVMRDRGIRHLPVLEGGQLVGIISDRDLYLVESLGAGNAAEIAVEEAMSQDVLTVSPEAPMTDVARTMAERRLGSAVVVRAGHVIGIFTSVDALKALAEEVGAAPPASGPERDARTAGRSAHR